jgi:hypothetical protein
MEERVKNCTNCTRGPQLLSQFEGKNGRPCNTCLKCREKGKKNDQKPERKEYHGDIQKERGAEYSAKHREKLKTGEEDKDHNLEQKCNWSKSEQTKDRLSKWKRLNVHDRISSSKRQAMAKDIEWHLTDEEAEKMLTSPCVYCGHLDLEVRLNGIDRLNQQGSYTTENTVPCCWTCNFMKGCMDPLTFIEQSKKIGECTYSFPEVPRQANIRPRKPNAPQPATPPSEPQTPLQ